MLTPDQDLEICGKIWLEAGGKTVIGSGRRAILSAVRETGSLNKAAQALNRSYRQVWRQIQTAETRLGQALLHKQKGGVNGGGASLTDFAESLLTLFDDLEHDIKQNMEHKFKCYLEKHTS